MMALAAVSLIEHPNLEGERPVVNVHRLVQAAMRSRLSERGETKATLARVMHRALPINFRPANPDIAPPWSAAHDYCRTFLPVATVCKPADWRCWRRPVFYFRFLGDICERAVILPRPSCLCVTRSPSTSGPLGSTILTSRSLFMILRCCTSTAAVTRRQRRSSPLIEVGEKTLDRSAPDAVTQFNSLAKIFCTMLDAKRRLKRVIAKRSK